jgi:hypothetical protein
MTTETTIQLFRDFWWLMFPMFGMVMAFWGMFQEDRRINQTLDRARRDLEQR